MSIHQPAHDADLGRIMAEEMWPEFSDAGPDAGGVGRQISGPQRTYLAKADDTSVRLDAHDRRS